MSTPALVPDEAAAHERDLAEARKMLVQYVAIVGDNRLSEEFKLGYLAAASRADYNYFIRSGLSVPELRQLFMEATAPMKEQA